MPSLQLELKAQTTKKGRAGDQLEKSKPDPDQSTRLADTPHYLLPLAGVEAPWSVLNAALVLTCLTRFEELKAWQEQARPLLSSASLSQDNGISEPYNGRGFSETVNLNLALCFLLFCPLTPTNTYISFDVAFCGSFTPLLFYDLGILWIMLKHLAYLWLDSIVW